MTGDDTETARAAVAPWEEATRATIASRIAGALAERAVTTLRINDPRACRSWDVRAREADLPRLLNEAADGTTLSGDGVAMLIETGGVRWIARGPIADALSAALLTRPG